jgi:hypothetical protein
LQLKTSINSDEPARGGVFFAAMNLAWIAVGFDVIAGHFNGVNVP